MSSPTVPHITVSDHDKPEEEAVMEEQTMEVTEFSLTFETDSDSDAASAEAELVTYTDSVLKGQDIRMDLAESAPYGSVEEVQDRTQLEPRRVSLDQFNSSIEDDAVVTQAIVTIG